MKTKLISSLTLTALFLLGAASLFLSGCATADPANESARPWNSPRGFEGGGLPSVLTDPRR